MSSSNMEQFENMTIADLRKLTEDFAKCQEVIAKQEETIHKLKIRYPNKKVDDEETLDINKFLETGKWN